MMRGVAVLLLWGLAGFEAGCAVPMSKACPGCPVLALGLRPPVQPGKKVVYLLVPGLLGYGWEWDGAQAQLRQLKHAATLVFPWQPWDSLHQSGEHFATTLNYMLHRLPRTVQKVCVVGHSAAGLLLGYAASRIAVPAHLEVELIAVGAPLAGQGFNPWAAPDLFFSPLPIALGSTFSRWPDPADRVAWRVFVTGQTDPVMKPRFGHDPASSGVLPRGTQRSTLPQTLDHNLALSVVAQKLREEEEQAQRRADQANPQNTPQP